MPIDSNIQITLVATDRSHSYTHTLFCGNFTCLLLKKWREIDL